MSRLIDFRQPFRFDFRALASFRIALGVLILIDLVGRATDLTAHYTDQGVLPRALLSQVQPSHWFFSIHSIFGSAVGQGLLFLLSGFIALCLIYGYHTRVSIFLSWILLNSLQARNPVINFSADVYFRLLLFWGLFLPLAAKVGTHPGARKSSYFGAASIAFVLQICLVYWCSFLHKLHPIWTTDATAVYYALELDPLVTPLGIWLKDFPRQLEMGTISVLMWEALGPLLLLCPSSKSSLRHFTLFCFFTLHLGMCSVLRLGIFSLVAWTAFLPLVPSSTWDLFERVVTFKNWKETVRFHFENRLLKFNFVGNVLAHVVATFLFFGILWWNLATMSHTIGWNVFGIQAYPGWLRTMMLTLHLDQNWNMFAPYPRIEDSWLVIPGSFSDGSTLDLWSGDELSWQKEIVVKSMYRNHRWLKFIEMLPSSNLYASYAQYLCQSSSYKEKKVVNIQIYQIKEPTPPPGERIPIASKDLVWKQVCL